MVRPRPMVLTMTSDEPAQRLSRKPRMVRWGPVRRREPEFDRPRSCTENHYHERPTGITENQGAYGPNQSRKPRIVRPTITTQSQGTNGPRHTTGPETPHTFCGPKARTKNQMIERPKGETQASLFTAQDGNASQDTYSQGLTMTMVHRPPTDSTGSHALNGGPANIRQPWCQRPPPIIRKANSQTGPPRISRKTISATGPPQCSDAKAKAYTGTPKA